MTKPSNQPERAHRARTTADTDADDANYDEAEAKQAQFPARLGHPEVEIAERSQDVEDKTASRHEKVFRAKLLRGGNKVAPSEQMHRNNINAMIDAAIAQGLRPTGPGEFVSAEDVRDDDGHPTGSVDLRYAVPVVPVSVTPVEEQRELERARVEERNKQLAEQRDDQGGNTPQKPAKKAAPVKASTPAKENGK
jgi:hypothetical protein